MVNLFLIDMVALKRAGCFWSLFKVLNLRIRTGYVPAS